jgi:hypothetical protein
MDHQVLTADLEERRKVLEALRDRKRQLRETCEEIEGGIEHDDEPVKSS